jgi:transmembrane sensor
VSEALDWIVRLKAGEAVRADIDALQQWRQRSGAHEEAFRTAARVFRHAAEASAELSDELAAPDVARVSRAPPGALSRRVVLGGALATMSAGYLIVRPPLALWPSLTELQADYRTGKGEQRKISVASDLSLELNTQTSIAMRPVPDETRVELISGEASVTASRLALKPFVMLAGDGRIVATDADFNARCLNGAVSVTCLNGAVDVARGSDVVRLHKAEQVSYSPAGIEASRAVDPDQVAAWQTGLLIFRDQPLESVVDEVNRYRSGKIIVTSPDLRRRVVNGTFQISKLGNFVLQVQQLFGAEARTLPGGVVLLS